MYSSCGQRLDRLATPANAGREPADARLALTEHAFPFLLYPSSDLQYPTSGMQVAAPAILGLRPAAWLRNSARFVTAAGRMENTKIWIGYFKLAHLAGYCQISWVIGLQLEFE